MLNIGSKGSFSAISICLFTIVGILRIWSAWSENQLSIVATEHLSATSSCAIDTPRIQWLGGSSPQSIDQVYFQAVVASALNTKRQLPRLEEWDRDPRLYYWFMAQTAVKNGQYNESLRYLAEASAGSTLDAAGHWSRTEACRIINWTIASEIGYREPPNGSVQGMMSHQQYEDVIVAFTRLLQYDPERTKWKLYLAQAYIGMGEAEIAENILAPILTKGTIDEIESAKGILQSSP